MLEESVETELSSILGHERTREWSGVVGMRFSITVDQHKGFKERKENISVKPQAGISRLTAWECRRMVRRMENARKNTTYPPPEVFAAQKRREEGDFISGIKKNFLGSLRRADYVARPG